jgi:DNA recombination protein RmuC
MEIMPSVVVVIVVMVVALVALGALVVVLALRGRTRPAALDEAVRRAVEDQRRVAGEERDAAVRAAVDHVLVQNRELLGSERVRVGQELEGKKSLIDQQLGSMNAKLDQVSTLMQTLEADRVQKFGRLSEQLTMQHEGVTALLQTTTSLREALSSTKARGQWGERMAEDVLRLAGFVENVNYRKQKVLDGARGMPDFTFLLPNDLLLHMDVKFPLDNYLRFCDATSDLESKRYKDDFLRDVKARIKELSSRDYIDASGGTVDFVLLFIPNEQLYAFIHEHDGDLIDAAVRQRVIFCSPLTLFAVLALIRQMVENFQLARTSDEILGLLGQFNDQWNKFVTQMDKVGARIEAAGNEYEALVGTRRRALERPLHKIEAIRSQQGDTLVPGLVDGLLDGLVDATDPGLALEV